MNSYAGIDWASRRHALCVVDQGGTTLSSEFYNHTATGIDKLIAQMRLLGRWIRRFPCPATFRCTWPMSTPGSIGLGALSALRAAV